jgi:hypothetical protein
MDNMQRLMIQRSQQGTHTTNLIQWIVPTPIMKDDICVTTYTRKATRYPYQLILQRINKLTLQFSFLCLHQINDAYHQRKFQSLI